MARKQEQNDDKHRKKSRERDRLTAKYQLLRLFWLLLIPLGFLWPRLAGGSAEGVENIYSGKIYPVISRSLAFVSSSIPISIGLAIVLGLTAVFVLLIVVRLIRMIFGKLIHKRRNRIRFYSILISFGIFFGVLVNLFYAFWGMNTFRRPLSDTLCLDIRQYSAEELASACRILACRAAELRENVNEDENGVYDLGSIEDELDEMCNAYALLGEEHKEFSNKVYPAKPGKLSALFSKLNMAGIYVPFTAEISINVDQPDLYILAGAAHETAHYFGFVPEAEAGFIAFMLADYTDDPALEYSLIMNALVYCGNALCAKSPALYGELRATVYTEGMLRDLESYREYIASYEDDPAGDIGEKINDTYLKYSGQSEGVQSYGLMVDYILAYYDAVGLLAS